MDICKVTALETVQNSLYNSLIYAFPNPNPEPISLHFIHQGQSDDIIFAMNVISTQATLVIVRHLIVCKQYTTMVTFIWTGKESRTSLTYGKNDVTTTCFPKFAEVLSPLGANQDHTNTSVCSMFILHLICKIFGMRS